MDIFFGCWNSSDDVSVCPSWRSAKRILTKFFPAGSHWSPSRHSSAPAACLRTEGVIACSATSQIPVWKDVNKTWRNSIRCYYHPEQVEMSPHSGSSSYGGEALLVLVGLHFVLSSPGGQVEGRHRRQNLLEARRCQRYRDGRGPGQRQAHGPAAHRDRLLNGGELHRAALTNRVQFWDLFWHEVLGVVELWFSQGF